MTELDLFNLARAITAVEIGYFTQMITINFAMIVAIYYFLNQANLVMKILVLGGVFYLLFFWKKSPEERDVTIRRRT